MNVVRCYDKRDGTLLHEETVAWPLAQFVAHAFPRIERLQARLWPEKYGHLPPTVYLIDREDWRP